MLHLAPAARMPMYFSGSITKTTAVISYAFMEANQNRCFWHWSIKKNNTKTSKPSKWSWTTKILQNICPHGNVFISSWLLFSTKVSELPVTGCTRIIFTHRIYKINTKRGAKRVFNDVSPDIFQQLMEATLRNTFIYEICTIQIIIFKKWFYYFQMTH